MEEEEGREEAIDGEPFDLAAHSVLKIGGGTNSDFVPLTVSFVTSGEVETSASVIIIASHQGRYLVALPSSVWHRTVARRLLPEGSLVKGTSLGVIASDPSDRSIIAPEVEVKVWIGYASEALLSNLSESGPESVDHPFQPGDPQCLPAATALEQVARSHFGIQSSVEESRPAPPEVGTRLDQLEVSFRDVKGSLEELTAAVRQALPAAVKKAQPSSGFATAAEDDADELGSLGVGARRVGPPPGLSAVMPVPKIAPANQASKLAARLSLDPTVVASAIQSGVSVKQLETMGKLVQEKPQRLEDLPRRSKGRQNPLSESEGEEEPEVLQPEAPSNLDPVTAALTQLTKIVTKLTDPKKKELSLKDALDGVGSASSSAQDGSVHFSSRKNAAALKAVKKALISSPKQIWKTVEQLMEEDYHMRAAAPGLGQQQMTARGWLQYRSRVQNYPQSVRWSWAAAGALDALRSGSIDEARARLCLMLCQAEQQSIDRGSWLLCQEIALESAPPYSAFQGHSLPDQTEQQFSKLLDPRWVDAFVSAVRENDDYVERRRKLGARFGRQTEDDHPAAKASAAKGKGKGKQNQTGRGSKGGNSTASSSQQAAE